MNKKAIRETATAILHHDLATRPGGKKIGFNMVPFYDEGEAGFEDKTGQGCGTVACIAGWSYFLNGGRSKKSFTICEKAQELLGLTDPQACALFAPDYKIRKEATPLQAAIVLYNLAETGKVDWSVVA